MCRSLTSRAGRPWMRKQLQHLWTSSWSLRPQTEPVKYEDPSRQYKFEGFKANAQLEATLRVPSIDFTFKTDPLETSKCDFAVMGNRGEREVLRRDEELKDRVIW